MSERDIGRLREDLDTMRQAAGIDLPFNRRDVWVLAPVGCAAGLAIAAIGWWQPSEYRMLAAIPAAVLVVAWLQLARSAHTRRAIEPVRWREMRYGLLCLLLVVPPFVGFLLWEAMSGMPAKAVVSSALFFMGLAIAWFAVVDRTRRSYFGAALPMILFGLAVPFLDPRGIRTGAGLMVVGAALATAAIQLWQLRQQRMEPLRQSGRAKDAD
ncbi:MAG: hypothetical protein ACOY3P_21750 [Planctomycetota bacterium]